MAAASAAGWSRGAVSTPGTWWKPLRNACRAGVPGRHAHHARVANALPRGQLCVRRQERFRRAIPGLLAERFGSGTDRIGLPRPTTETIGFSTATATIGIRGRGWTSTVPALALVSQVEAESAGLTLFTWLGNRLRDACRSVGPAGSAGWAESVHRRPAAFGRWRPSPIEGPRPDQVTVPPKAVLQRHGVGQPSRGSLCSCATDTSKLRARTKSCTLAGRGRLCRQ